MKRSQIYLVILGIWLCLGANSLAQAPPPNYRIEFVTHPDAEGYSLRDANNLGVAVGFVKSTDVTGTKSFVVDQNGEITRPIGQVIKKQYLLEELVDIPPELIAEYPYRFINAINESCQVVGRFSNGNSQMIGFFADLNAPGSFEVLPNPALAGRVHGREINERGDVLILSDLAGQPVNHYIYNPMDPGTAPSLLTVPGTTQAFEGSVNGFNNLRQVVGYLSGVPYRLTPGVSLETFDTSLSVFDINDSGQFCGTQTTLIGQQKKRNNQYARFAYRYTNQTVEPVASLESNAYSINSSGDVFGIRQVDGRNSLFVFHDDHGSLDLDDLVVGTADDLAFLSAARLDWPDINDRDAETGFGQLFGTAYITTTTGKGKNQVTTTDSRIFILTPELP